LFFLLIVPLELLLERERELPLTGGVRQGNFMNGTDV